VTSIDPTPGRRLADGLLQWVTDDALLGDDRTMTYGEARTRFGIPGSDIGMGRVLDDAHDLIKAELGERVALGVVAYVVNARTGVPGGGWDEHLHGGRKEAGVARRDARAALHERRMAD
jgi:hypothetical protein